MVVKFFGPLRVSESKSMRRKAATIEKVIESVKQAVISSYIWSESIINKTSNMKSVEIHSFRLRW